MGKEAVAHYRPNQENFVDLKNVSNYDIGAVGTDTTFAMRRLLLNL